MTRRRWINIGLVAAIVVVVVAIALALRGGGEPVEAQRTVTVATSTVEATASATGEVVAPGSVSLAFTSTGLVTSVDVEPGDVVTAGQVLATVDDTAARQQVAAARSTLAQAQANAANAASQLALTKASVAESNTSLDAAVTQAQANLDAAEKQWSEACLNPDDPTCPNPAAAEAVRQAANSITVAQLSYDIAVENAAKNEITYNLAVNQANDSLVAAKAYASSQCSTYGDTSTQCKSAQDAILPKQQAYDSQVNSRTMSMMRDQQSVKQASMTLSNANVAMRKLQADARKAQQDAIRQARQALDNATIARDRGRVANEQSVQSAKTAVTETESGLSTSEAAVAAAQAGLAIAREALADTSLVSPIAGEVGAVNLTVGESAVGSATASRGVTVVPTGGFEVEAAFAESDAADLEVGQAAEVTFEGLPGVTSSGRVLSVDPVATTSATNNLVTFTVRIALDDVPPGLRQGMTATVSVTTKVAQNVLAVPQSAITAIGDSNTVEVANADGTTTRVEVTTDVQGDVLTEITSGLTEGQELVIPTASTSGFPTGGVPGGGGGPFGGGPRDEN